MEGYTVDLNRKNVQEKIKRIQEVEAEMKNYKTYALIELRNLPDSLLQSSRKKIRSDGGVVIAAKKAILKRVFEKDKKLTKFVESCSEPVALILSNSTPYELNKFFKNNKKKMAAKAGQISPYEIVVPAGETELPPGPALSELKVAGLAVQIKAGKIAVSKDSVLAKEGEEINQRKAKALQMLGILPFEKWINVLYAYDGEYVYSPDALSIDAKYVSEGVMYAFQLEKNLSLNAKIPVKSTIDLMLTQSFMQANNFALNAKVYSKGTIGQLLGLASSQGSALSSLDTTAKAEVNEEKEKPSEEKKEEPKVPESEKPTEEKSSEAKPEEKKE